jgi:hypothetical protein
MLVTACAAALKETLAGYQEVTPSSPPSLPLFLVTEEQGGSALPHHQMLAPCPLHWRPQTGRSPPPLDTAGGQGRCPRAGSLHEDVSMSLSCLELGFPCHMLIPYSTLLRVIKQNYKRTF